MNVLKPAFSYSRACEKEERTSWEEVTDPEEREERVAEREGRREGGGGM